MKFWSEVALPQSAAYDLRLTTYDLRLTNMLVAVIAIEVGLSLGCWLLVWWLMRLRRQAAAIELRAIELTMLCERELPNLQLNFARYRQQIRTTLATYDDTIEKIDAGRQLIYAITWLRAIVSWQKRVRLKRAKRKNI